MRQRLQPIAVGDEKYFAMISRAWSTGLTLRGFRHIGEPEQIPPPSASRQCDIAGGKSQEKALQQPQAAMDFYRDISVLAFPTASGGEAEGKPSVSTARIVDLTGKMDAQGILRCDLPAGNWTVLRFGHTTTGVQNHPAPDGGLGLETDKLSRAATLFQFESLMGRIIKMVGPLAGTTLVAAASLSAQISSDK